MPDSTLNLCLGKPLVRLRPRAVCFSHYTTVPVSVFVSCQERGQYDAAARHGVAPWKQGLLCALLAAWDIFVNSHTLEAPSEPSPQGAGQEFAQGA